MTLGKAVLGEIKKGAEDFFRQKKGGEDIFRVKKGGEDFFQAIFSPKPGLGTRYI